MVAKASQVIITTDQDASNVLATLTVRQLNPTVPITTSVREEENANLLRQSGADLREVPAVPYANPNNYVKVSGRLAEEIATHEPAGAIWANQFDNVANRQAHIETTAEEEPALEVERTALFGGVEHRVSGAVTIVT